MEYSNRNDIQFTFNLLLLISMHPRTEILSEVKLQILD